jgi:hypothetical protein
MFWFNKKHPHTVYGDIRRKDFIACDGRSISIQPDIEMDFKNIPFPDESFYHVVFDPPHLKGAGKTGWMAQKYGTLGSDWKNELKLGFKECMRVLKVNGTLIFKWNEESIKVSELVKLFGVEPLYGHRTRQSSKTIWMAFLKTSHDQQSED